MRHRLEAGAHPLGEPRGRRWCADARGAPSRRFRGCCGGCDRSRASGVLHSAGGIMAPRCGAGMASVHGRSGVREEPSRESGHRRMPHGGEVRGSSGSAASGCRARRPNPAMSAPVDKIRRPNLHGCSSAHTISDFSRACGSN